MGFGSRRPGVPKYVRRVFDRAGQCPKDQPGPSGQPLIALQGPRSQEAQEAAYDRTKDEITIGEVERIQL
jgi:hypothetical protein